jgi:hypothetical protein
MNRRTLILVSIAIIIIAGTLTAYKTWNKPFADASKGNAIKITANQLFSEFSTNESEAEKKYVPKSAGDKILEVTGVIREIGKDQSGNTYLNLKTDDEMFGVKCVMDNNEEIINAKNNDKITLRGFCDGFNMDVILNRCKLVNTKG